MAMCGHSRTVKTGKFIIEAMGGTMMLKPHTQLDDLYLAYSPFDKLAIGMSDYNVPV